MPQVYFGCDEWISSLMRQMEGSRFDGCFWLFCGPSASLLTQAEDAPESVSAIDQAPFAKPDEAKAFKAWKKSVLCTEYVHTGCI